MMITLSYKWSMMEPHSTTQEQSSTVTELFLNDKVQKNYIQSNQIKGAGLAVIVLGLLSNFSNFSSHKTQMCFLIKNLLKTVKILETSYILLDKKKNIKS